MEKEVLQVATKAEEDKESEVEVELPEDTFNLKILINTRDCVVL